MDLFLVLTTLVVLAATILFDWWYFHWLRSKRLPPGPTPWPVVGNFPQVVRQLTDLGTASRKLEAKYGKIITFWMGRKPLIFVNDADLTHDALVKQGIFFANRPKTLSMRTVSDNFRTLNTSEGPLTVALRKNVMTHMLGPAKLKANKQHRDRAYEGIINAVKSAATENGEAEVNVRYTVFQHIFKLALVLVFGVELKEHVVEELRRILSERFRLAFRFYFSDYFTVFKLFERKYFQTLEDHQRKLEEIFSPIIDRLRQLQGQDSVIQGNYCETLFQLEKAFPDISNSVITCLCGEFINGAVQTTSGAIDTAMAWLCEHPEVQKKLYAEIEATVGKRAVDESDLPNLPYLSAVVRETLRRNPPARVTLAHATSELRKLGGYEIPTDAVVFFGVEAFHHDPNRWSDPLTFKPERFLEDDLDVHGTRDCSFLPFGLGRRICPGIQLAMLELSVVVARMVQTFEWRAPSVKKAGSELGSILCAQPRPV